MPEYKPHNLIGKEISINFKKRTFFGVDSIWLSPSTWCDTIPEDISSSGLKKIQDALRMEEIYLGRKKTTSLDQDPGFLKTAVLKVKNTDISKKRQFNELKEFIVDLTRTETMAGYTTRDIASIMIKAERDGKNRKELLEFLQEALTIIDERFHILTNINDLDNPDNQKQEKTKEKPAKRGRPKKQKTKK